VTGVTGPDGARRGQTGRSQRGEEISPVNGASSGPMGRAPSVPAAGSAPTALQPLAAPPRKHEARGALHQERVLERRVSRFRSARTGTGGTDGRADSLRVRTDGSHRHRRPSRRDDAQAVHRGLHARRGALARGLAEPLPRTPGRRPSRERTATLSERRRRARGRGGARDPADRIGVGRSCRDRRTAGERLGRWFRGLHGQARLLRGPARGRAPRPAPRGLPPSDDDHR